MKRMYSPLAFACVNAASGWLEDPKGTQNRKHKKTDTQRESEKGGVPSVKTEEGAQRR